MDLNYSELTLLKAIGKINTIDINLMPSNQRMPVSLGKLHHYILRHVIETQSAPSVNDIAHYFDITLNAATALLRDLQEYHGVVLHPNNSKIWVIHPFSMAPTAFTIISTDKKWWGTCAWCSFGATALIDENVVIETKLGADGDNVILQVNQGELLNKDYVVHFPVKMSDAWDNVIFTCSVMLLFRNETEVDTWCRRHGISKGDVQPAAKIFDFAREWYGNHLHPEWKKWSNEEAAAIFEKYGLKTDIWAIPSTSERF